MALRDFPNSWVGKESTCNAGGPSLIPRSGRSTGEGRSYPLQDSWASLVAQLVKNLPTMQNIWVQLTPVFWPGEFYGLSSPWGHKESDITEPLSLSHGTEGGKIAIFWIIFFFFSAYSKEEGFFLFVFLFLFFYPPPFSVKTSLWKLLLFKFL